MYSITFLTLFPSAAKESQVRSKSKTSKFHSLISAQHCIYKCRGGEGILGHHISVPWLLIHTLRYNGTSSCLLTFLPDLRKKPTECQLPPVCSPRPREMIQSQTESRASAVIHISSVDYVPSQRHLPSHGQRCNVFLRRVKHVIAAQPLHNCCTTHISPSFCTKVPSAFDMCPFKFSFLEC